MTFDPNDPHRYDDMLDLPHHRSQRHAPMSRANRAAQFAPFAALTGFDAAIRETARATEDERELANDARELLDRTIVRLRGMNPFPRVAVTTFVPDAKKAGGSYKRTVGRLQAITRAGLTVNGKLLQTASITDIEILEDDA